MADYKFEDTKRPDGFAWNKYKTSVDRDRAQLTIPALVTWGKNVGEPEVDDEGRKKYSVAIAIPKSKETEALMEAIRKAEGEIAKANGIKGAFPSAFRDGDAKDGSGLYLKSGGKLAGFWYATAKTRKQPRVIERGDGAFLEYDANAVNAGGYMMLSTSMIIIGHGSDTKKGTSLWFDKILWLGGGNQIAGGSSQSDDDAFDLMADTGSTSSSSASSFI